MGDVANYFVLLDEKSDYVHLALAVMCTPASDRMESHILVKKNALGRLKRKLVSFLHSHFSCRSSKRSEKRRAALRLNLCAIASKRYMSYRRSDLESFRGLSLLSFFYSVWAHWKIDGERREIVEKWYP